MGKKVIFFKCGILFFMRGILSFLCANSLDPIVLIEKNPNNLVVKKSNFNSNS